MIVYHNHTEKLLPCIVKGRKPGASHTQPGASVQISEKDAAATMDNRLVYLYPVFPPKKISFAEEKQILIH